MNREEKAVELFRQGYNCAQSVFCAYADDLGLNLDQAAHLSSSFGGGMGHLGEACGALTGSFMALGLEYGYGHPVDKETKTKFYADIKEIGEAFRVAKGSTRCDDLLEFNKSRPKMEIDGKPVKECEHLVRQAVRLAENYRMNQRNQVE